jgi:hypothetical protein
VLRFLSAAFLLPPAILAQSVTIAPCGIPGVTVTAPPSAEFFESVDDILGPSRQPIVNAWLPYGLAITNRSPQNIAALAVRWVVTDANGRTLPVSFTPQMFDQPKQQLAPGKTVLAVPAALLGAAQAPHTLHLTHLGEFQAARKIQAHLDGVVFASGQFVGPNNTKAFEELVAQTTAPVHVASTVLAMKESREPIAAVVAWLDTNAKTRNGRTARRLLDSYKRGGETLLYEVAEGYAKGPTLRLYK